jgi:hypothetical protein
MFFFNHPIPHINNGGMFNHAQSKPHKTGQPTTFNEYLRLVVIKLIYEGSGKSGGAQPM